MKKNLMGNEKGFTLIEIIVVIVILGILAAVAVPKYMDMTAEAHRATANGLFAAARGAATMNFAKNLAGSSVTPITNDADGAVRLLSLIDASSEYGIIATGAGTGTGTLTATLGSTNYVISITASETVTGTTPAAALLTKGWTP